MKLPMAALMEPLARKMRANFSRKTQRNFHDKRDSGPFSLSSLYRISNFSRMSLRKTFRRMELADKTRRFCSETEVDNMQRLTTGIGNFPPEGETDLAVGVLADPVVIDASVVAKRDGHLPGAALALPHEERAVDARTQQVLGGVTRHGPVVPRELVEAVDRRDVVAGDPAQLAALVAHFGPFLRLVVA